MVVFFFQAEDGIRDADVTGVQTCALPISPGGGRPGGAGRLRGTHPAAAVPGAGRGGRLVVATGGAARAGGRGAERGRRGPAVRGRRRPGRCDREAELPGAGQAAGRGDQGGGRGGGGRRPGRAGGGTAGEQVGRGGRGGRAGDP